MLCVAYELKELSSSFLDNVPNVPASLDLLCKTEFFIWH